MSVPLAVVAVEALHPLLIRILGKVSFSLTLLMLVEALHPLLSLVLGQILSNYNKKQPYGCFLY